jgi:hypothetical protein
MIVILSNRMQPTQKLTLGNVKAEENATDVVTSTIPLFGSVACILFDSGATNSFISSTYVKLCKLSMELRKQNICVATPVGNAVTCKKCVDNCLFVIEWKTLSTKLAMFSKLGYGANIDCHKNEAIFQIRVIEEFKFCRSCVRATLPLLSVIQAIKSVRKGA